MTHAPPMTNDEVQTRLSFLRHWWGIRHSAFPEVIGGVFVIRHSKLTSQKEPINISENYPYE